MPITMTAPPSGIVVPRSRGEILDKLQEAMADVTLDKPLLAPLTEDTRLREDLGFDSFAALELIFQLEETFQIRIPQGAAMSFSTVGDVVTYIAEQLESAQAPAGADGGGAVVS